MERSLDVGVTGFIPKSSARGSLLELIEATRPKAAAGPVLIIDDDPEALREHEQIVSEGFPGVSTRLASDGEEALRLMREEAPCLVLLDLAMPVMDGMELLDRMRKDQRLRRVPVIVLTNKSLDSEDVRRIEAHARVVLQAKGVWSEAETVAALNRSLFGPESLPPQTSALVKRAVAWLSRNHARDLSRWQLAEAVNASEDYVSRVFQRELGLSPWEYLGRYRVHKARELLRATDDSVKAIAARVGFHDQAYFCRVFRKLTGVTPHEYRQEQ
jgi:YesN/AraC family two-component response regulator